MKISSSSFRDGGTIAPKHATRAIPGGENISPQIRITDVPAGTASLAVALIDRLPMARNWVHWLVVNIPPARGDIAEGASLKSMPAGALELMNTFGQKGYGGPQPPRGSGVHPYELCVYALSGPLSVSGELSERDFLGRIKGLVLEKGKITAGFEYK